MAIVRLGSKMTSMIEKLKDMITGYNDYERFQNKSEVQVENEEVTVMHGELDQVDYRTMENARCHS